MALGLDSVFGFGRSSQYSGWNRFCHQSVWNVTTWRGWILFSWLVTKTDTWIRTLVGVGISGMLRAYASNRKDD